jgi:hypothetical protein
LIKDKGVRISRLRIRYRESGDFSGGGIKLTDVCLSIPRVPDLSVYINNQIVGTRTRLQIKALESAVIRFKISEIIALLAYKPYSIQVIHIRVPWSGALPGNRPLGDLRGLVSMGNPSPER